MNWKISRFVVLSWVLQICLIVVAVEVDDEVFIPSERVLYIKRSPNGPIIKTEDHLTGSSTHIDDDSFSKAENQQDDTKFIFKGDEGLTTSAPPNMIHLSPTSKVLAQISGENVQKTINLPKVPILKTNSEARSGKKISDFPYEYWKPSSNNQDIESIAEESDSKVKKDYGFYYGEEVENKDIFDSSTWTVHPIKLPIDVIGEVNEKTTKNPMKEITNYPSSVIPQYGRHPGATESPPLYFPKSFSAKKEKQTQVFRDRAGIESLPQGSMYTYYPVKSGAPTFGRPPPSIDRRNERYDYELAPSTRVEVINPGGNVPLPPHIFYPIQNSQNLQIGILRKNKTRPYFNTHFHDDKGLIHSFHDNNGLIHTLHDKTKQVFKVPNAPKTLHSTGQMKLYNPKYNILDYSRYDMQKRVNPKMARKKYNENLVDIIQDKFSKNQNHVFNREPMKNVISNSPLPKKNSQSESHRTDGNFLSKKVNTTNLVKPHATNSNHHQNNFIRTNNYHYDNWKPNPMHKSYFGHHPPPPYYAYNHKPKLSFSPNQKTDQFYYKRPPHHQKPAIINNKITSNPKQKFTNSQHSPPVDTNYGQYSSNEIVANNKNSRQPSEMSTEMFDAPVNGYPSPVSKSQTGSTQPKFKKPDSLTNYHDRSKLGSQDISRPTYSKFNNFHKNANVQQMKLDPYRPPKRPVTEYSRPLPPSSSAVDPLEATYDNSLKAKLIRFWNAGFLRKARPSAPNAYPEHSGSSSHPQKDPQNLLYYYLDNSQEEIDEQPAEKTFLERIASIQSAPAAVVIPGGLAAFGLGLAFYYFNYIWYPTPVVTARLSKLLISYADNNIFSEKQENEIEKMVEVFSGLESNYFTSAINSVSCRNRLVCQLHQDIPSLWEVTQIISPVVSLHLESKSPDEVKALKNYLTVAQQGIDNVASCKELFKSCSLPYLPLKPLLNTIFKGSSKTENENGESRVL